MGHVSGGSADGARVLTCTPTGASSPDVPAASSSQRPRLTRPLAGCQLAAPRQVTTPLDRSASHPRGGSASPLPRLSALSHRCLRGPVGSEEARPERREPPVRRSHGPCGSPAGSVHEGTAGGHGCTAGISESRLTSPNWPRRRHVGTVLHPAQRPRWWRCDHSRRTTHRSSWLTSLRT